MQHIIVPNDIDINGKRHSASIIFIEQCCQLSSSQLCIHDFFSFESIRHTSRQEWSFVFCVFFNRAPSPPHPCGAGSPQEPVKSGPWPPYGQLASRGATSLEETSPCLTSFASQSPHSAKTHNAKRVLGAAPTCTLARVCTNAYTVRTPKSPITLKSSQI